MHHIQSMKETYNNQNKGVNMHVSHSYQEAKKNNKYDLQAEYFLHDIGVKFECKYLKTAKHFHDDKCPRDIYTITLSRGSRSMTGTFGQSYICSGKFHKWGYYERGIINEKPKVDRMRSWIINKNFEEPTEYNILACLTKNDVGSFDEFICDFGYVIDSKESYESTQKTYKACVKEWDDVQKLFSNEEIEELQEIT